MKLGIMSDTHDNLRMIDKAVQLFTAEGVEAVLHAGDFIAPFSVRRLLGGLKVPLYGVFGNNDGERVQLKALLGDRLRPSPAVWDLGPWRVLVAHELEENVGRALAASGVFRLVVFGHTHKPLHERLGEGLLVNPGECGGWLYGKATVAVVDLASLEVRFFTLDG